MSDKRRGLGRGLGALIPPAPSGAQRPSDVFFAERSPGSDAQSTQQPERELDAADGFTGNNDSGFTGNLDVAAAAEATASAENSAGPELRQVPGAQFADLPLSSIRPNPKQPRTNFDEDDMAELVHSIREIGVLQPVVVRPIPADAGAPEGVAYELIMGERRFRASGIAGRESVPAIIRSTTDDHLLRDALLENLHRSQLNPLEEAAAYQQLLDDFDCTHDELATRISRSRPQISNTIRLLKLPPLVARRVAAGVLSAGHARALLGLPDSAAMERVAQRIVAEGLSVRSTEEIVALGGQPEQTSRTSPTMGARHPQLDDLAAQVSDQLDTRVGITLGKRKGKLTVEFASMDDLNRILDTLGLQRQ